MKPIADGLAGQDLVIHASTWRRLFMLATLAGLGLVLLLLGFGAAPQPLGWRLALIGIGAAIMGFVPYAWGATARGVALTQAGLADTTGLLICSFDQIAAVERGSFAFKPSHGFLVRLETPRPRYWAPGIWWRWGRRVGIGGILAGGQTKLMADLIAARLAARATAGAD